MNKKRILFVIESLDVAGGEKSLVSLLSQLDYNKYEVDLQLFKYGGGFEGYLPKEVNLLSPFKYTKYLESKSKGNLSMLFSRLMYSIALRLGKKTIRARARYYWELISRNIEKNPNHYNIAIGYGQCHPTFYVVDKVDADLRLGWVNCIFHLSGREKRYQERFYKDLDKIVLVSEPAFVHFRNVYPNYVKKMHIMPDLIISGLISRMADEGESFSDGYMGNRILTVARLDKQYKGYDITLESCKILKERGRQFRWYALGRGEYRLEMERYIAEHGLKDTFFLLGVTPNPYPYIRDCTLYVQTSRHEGFGLSIAEARMLNKPVVTTEFEAVWQQMVQGKNGLVVAQSPVAVADAIERLLDDKQLYNHIVAYQQQEKKGNIEEIERFYRLIEES